MIQLHSFALELIANGGFPTKHLSYSSIKEYLSNPRSFLKKYIRYEFDDSTKGTFMVGKSVHKALEIVFNTYKETGEIPTLDEAVQFWYSHFNREIKEAQCKALAKWVQTQGGSAEFPIFTKELETEDIEKFYEDFCLQAREFIIIPEEIGEKSPEEELAWIDGYIKDNIENTLITLGAGGTFDSMIQESKDEIAIALSNFYSLGDRMIPNMKIHSTEREEKVFFLDENGDEMPIALKAISDRIDEFDDACEIIDYKTVAKFSETDAEKADYEMQAGANYFTALVATWKTPNRMHYIEILKSFPGYCYAHDEEWVVTPCSYKYDLIALAKKHWVALDEKRIRVVLPENKDQKLLKSDLEKLVADRGVILEVEKPNVEDLTNALLTAGVLVEEFGVTNTVEEMRERLIASKILKTRPGVKIVTIDFEERPDVVATFLSLYKGVVNMIAISELCGVYLPNISAQWGGLEAYQDFKEFESIPKAPVIKKIVQEKEEEIEIL